MKVQISNTTKMALLAVEHDVAWFNVSKRGRVARPGQLSAHTSHDRLGSFASPSRLVVIFIIAPIGQCYRGYDEKCCRCCYDWTKCVLWKRWMKKKKKTFHVYLHFSNTTATAVSAKIEHGTNTSSWWWMDLLRAGLPGWILSLRKLFFSILSNFCIF